MSDFTFTIRLLGATATLMLVAACGNSTGGTPVTNASAGAGSSASQPAPAAVLGVASTSLGPVLVDSLGLTVYLLTADKPGVSTCNAKCLQFWPPVPPPAGTGVLSVQGITAVLTTTKTTSGAATVTAGGWPLYTFAKDKAPGDVTGQGLKSFGGTWYAVSPSGKAVTMAVTKVPATTAPASTSGAGGGGNGY